MYSCQVSSFHYSTILSVISLLAPPLLILCVLVNVSFLTYFLTSAIQAKVKKNGMYSIDMYEQKLK